MERYKLDYSYSPFIKKGNILLMMVTDE